MAFSMHLFPRNWTFNTLPCDVMQLIMNIVDVNDILRLYSSGDRKLQNLLLAPHVISALDFGTRSWIENELLYRITLTLTRLNTIRVGVGARMPLTLFAHIERMQPRQLILSCHQQSEWCTNPRIYESNSRYRRSYSTEREISLTTHLWASLYSIRIENVCMAPKCVETRRALTKTLCQVPDQLQLLHISTMRWEPHTSDYMHNFDRLPRSLTVLTLNVAQNDIFVSTTYLLLTLPLLNTLNISSGNFSSNNDLMTHIDCDYLQGEQLAYQMPQHLTSLSFVVYQPKSIHFLKYCRQLTRLRIIPFIFEQKMIEDVELDKILPSSLTSIKVDFSLSSDHTIHHYLQKFPQSLQEMHLDSIAPATNLDQTFAQLQDLSTLSIRIRYSATYDVPWSNFSWLPQRLKVLDVGNILIRTKSQVTSLPTTLTRLQCAVDRFDIARLLLSHLPSCQIRSSAEICPFTESNWTWFAKKHPSMEHLSERNIAMALEKILLGPRFYGVLRPLSSVDISSGILPCLSSITSLEASAFIFYSIAPKIPIEAFDCRALPYSSHWQVSARGFLNAQLISLLPNLKSFIITDKGEMDFGVSDDWQLPLSLRNLDFGDVSFPPLVSLHKLPLKITRIVSTTAPESSKFTWHTSPVLVGIGLEPKLYKNLTQLDLPHVFFKLDQLARMIVPERVVLMSLGLSFATDIRCLRYLKTFPHRHQFNIRLLCLPTGSLMDPDTNVLDRDSLLASTNDRLLREKYIKSVTFLDAAKFMEIQNSIFRPSLARHDFVEGDCWFPTEVEWPSQKSEECLFRSGSMVLGGGETAGEAIGFFQNHLHIPNTVHRVRISLPIPICISSSEEASSAVPGMLHSDWLGSSIQSKLNGYFLLLPPSLVSIEVSYVTNDLIEILRALPDSLQHFNIGLLPVLYDAPYLINFPLPRSLKSFKLRNRLVDIRATHLTECELRLHLDSLPSTLLSLSIHGFLVECVGVSPSSESLIDRFPYLRDMDVHPGLGNSSRI